MISISLPHSSELSGLASEKIAGSSLIVKMVCGSFRTVFCRKMLLRPPGEVPSGPGELPSNAWVVSASEANCSVVCSSLGQLSFLELRKRRAILMSLRSTTRCQDSDVWCDQVRLSRTATDVCSLLASTISLVSVFRSYTASPSSVLSSGRLASCDWARPNLPSGDGGNSSEMLCSEAFLAMRAMPA